MDTETEEQERLQADSSKLQQAYFIGKYQPQAGRADRLASNLPGAKSIGSTKGTLR